MFTRWEDREPTVAGKIQKPGSQDSVVSLAADPALSLRITGESWSWFCGF
jgi:hypothetical protein